MGELFRKCQGSIGKVIDRVFINNVANIVMLVVALLLVIALMTSPSILIALALFGLFICAILYG